MSSKNLSNPHGGNRRQTRPTKAAPGTTDLDRPLKLATAQAMTSAGFYVRLNVVLSEPRGLPVKRDTKWVTDITDIDVLGVVHTLDLRADTSCVTCKAGTNVSVLHETFALAGVMQYLHAQRGYGVFLKKNTEPHMIALAEQLGVAVMDEPEWNHWRRRLSGSHPTPRHFEDQIDALISGELSRRIDLAELLSYLRTEFWYFRDYRNVQNLIGQVRRVADKLTTSPLTMFLLLDACGQFALALLQLCEHVNASGVLRLKDTVSPYLFGGIPTYRNRRDLLRRVEDFMRKKSVLDATQSMPPLDPDYVPDLSELVLRFCNRPAAAGRVPQYLNFRAGEIAAVVAGEKTTRTAHNESDFTEKLAFDLVEFIGKAARIDPGVVRAIQGYVEPTSGKQGGRDIPTQKVDGGTARAIQTDKQPSLLESAGDESGRKDR